MPTRSIQSVRFKNLLSFGPDSSSIELRSLNILIGINGSGKSNLIEGLRLFQAAPDVLAKPVRNGGGVHDWFWKNNNKSADSAELEIEVKIDQQRIKHRMQFGQSRLRFELWEEHIEELYPKNNIPFRYERAGGMSVEWQEGKENLDDSAIDN